MRAPSRLPLSTSFPACSLRPRRPTVSISQYSVLFLGVVLFRRSGFEQEFNELAAEAVEAAGEEFEVIPLTSGDDCDRLFIAPREERSFARSD